MRQGSHNEIGQSAVIADDVTLGDNVVIGNHVTIYPQVTIEDNCRIMDGAVIGRLTYPTSIVSRAAPTTHQPLRIGAGSVIGCHVVLYTNNTIGRDVLLADGVSIREGCILEDSVFLGRSVMVNYNTRICTRTRIMDLTHITGNAHIGTDCFIGMLVSTANDNDVYLRRFKLDDGTVDVKGPTIGNYVLIGHGSTVNPGVRIGDGAILGSGALATRDIPAWVIAMGMPAQAKSQVKPEVRQKIVALAASRGQKLEDPPVESEY